jgi:hypothetical protein
VKSIPPTVPPTVLIFRSPIFTVLGLIAVAVAGVTPL